MKIIIYRIKDFKRSYSLNPNKLNHELSYAEEALSEETGD